MYPDGNLGVRDTVTCRRPTKNQRGGYYTLSLLSVVIGPSTTHGLRQFSTRILAEDLTCPWEFSFPNKETRLFLV